MVDAFEAAVEDALGRCRHGGTLLAAVSGGADSTAMLLAAAASRVRLGYRLHCLHVDHGIRSEAECAADASFVRNLCASLDVPCRVARIERGVIRARAEGEGLGLEAAARDERHAAWTEEARSLGAGRVLVAHTADDLLETVLMRFLRGAGPAGLASMAEERGIVFRPLLSRKRAEVLEYLGRKNIPFRTDSTNADPAYFRNRVRLRLVSLLDAEFPHWRRAVFALAETQAETAEFIAEESAVRVAWQGEKALYADERAFFAQHGIIRQEAVYAAVDRLAAAPERADAIPSADVSARRKTEPRRTALRTFTSGRSRAADLGAYRVERRDGSVYVERTRAHETGRGFTVVAREPGTYSAGAFAVSTVEGGPREAGFAARLPLIFRNVEAEDRILCAGRAVSIVRKSAESGISKDGVVIAEDLSGIAAAFWHDAEGKVKLLLREGRNESAGYADFIFFSILIQRG